MFYEVVQNFVLLEEILGYNDVNLNKKEGSEVATIYAIVSLSAHMPTYWDLSPILFS